MAIEIIEVKSKKDFKRMIDLPWKLYKNDKFWVPQLKIAIKDMFSPKHPFFENAKMKTWIALNSNKEVIGRIAAIVNKNHNEFHNDKCGFFGFFESINSEEVTRELFKVAEKYLKEAGMEHIRGPVQLSINYECGTLISGFEDPPQIMMNYNPKYHQKLIEACGYKKAKDLLAYTLPANTEQPRLIKRIADRVEKSHRITYRSINKKDWNNEVKRMHDIYTNAWEKNWGFVPMTPAEFAHTAKDLKSVIDEKLIMFIEVNGKTAAFIVCLPDLNQVFKKNPSGTLFPTGLLKLIRFKKYVNRCRIITLGVKKEYRSLGIASLMYARLADVIRNDPNYDEIEMSWVLEDNKEMNKPLLLMGAKPYKSYRIFEKDL